MNAIAPIGHNCPPDPIDQINAAFEAVRLESENWLDGALVTNERQMREVDKLRNGARQWRQALEAGEASAAKPLHDAWKAEKARWKPTLEDARRIEGGLVALVDGFKRQLAAAKDEARRKAEAEAWEATRAAREAVQAANAADIEAQREAAEAMRQAEEAQARAAAAKADTVKGLRGHTVTEVFDMTAWAREAWSAHRDECEAFFTDLARKHRPNIPGVVETRKERRAY